MQRTTCDQLVAIRAYRRFRAARVLASFRRDAYRFSGFWSGTAFHARWARRGVGQPAWLPQPASVPVRDPRSRAHVSRAGVPGALSARRLGRPGNVAACLFFCRRDHRHGQAPWRGPHRVPRAGRKVLMPGALAPNPRPLDTDPLHCFRLLGQPPVSGTPASTPGSRPRSRRAGCQASPDPRASVRPIATSAHPARCLTERRPRRRGTWGRCRRADLRSSLSRWPASRPIMYGCIVFTY